MTRRDLWPLIVFMATGTITAVMYLAFAVGYTVYARLPTWAKPLWKYSYGAVFVLADILYNLTIGSLMWAERPTFETFTARLNRKKVDYAFARWLCECLSIFDPDHCR